MSAPADDLMAGMIGALSHALDLTKGQPAIHCVRWCWIGMHVGEAPGMESGQFWDLYCTLLLKDAGCISNAARLFQLYGRDDYPAAAPQASVQYRHRDPSDLCRSSANHCLYLKILW